MSRLVSIPCCHSVAQHTLFSLSSQSEARYSFFTTCKVFAAPVRFEKSWLWGMSSEDILNGSSVYNTSTTDLNKKNGRVQASSRSFRLKSIKLVAQSVLQLLRLRRILFTTVHKLTESSEDFRVLSRLQSINVIAISNQKLRSITKSFMALNKDTTTNNNTS